MNKLETFYQDIEECDLKVSHVDEGITDPALKELDNLYGKSSAISKKNVKNNERNLRVLSAFVPAMALLFVLYETTFHWIIIMCIATIITIFYASYRLERSDIYRKSIEYRLMAEILRVQYFLSISNAKKEVKDILPWFIQKATPWIPEALSNLPKREESEKKPIINIWIRHQKKYHRKALVDATKEKEKNERIVNVVVFLTVACYFFALFLEIYLLSVPSGEITYKYYNGIEILKQFGATFNLTATGVIHTFLKIIVGVMSAITLYAGNYYGRMSLSNKIDNHRRMLMLYAKAETEVLDKGESDELIINLARESLIENTLWYSNQSVNSPKTIFE